jgi:hypothetical protein
LLDWHYPTPLDLIRRRLQQLLVCGCAKKRESMLDVVMLALGFFGVSVSYAYACERL